MIIKYLTHTKITRIVAYMDPQGTIWGDGFHLTNGIYGRITERVADGMEVREQFVVLCGVVPCQLLKE